MSQTEHDKAWEKNFVVPIAKEMKARGVGYLLIAIRDDGKANYVLDPKRINPTKKTEEVISHPPHAHVVHVSKQIKGTRLFIEEHADSTFGEPAEPPNFQQEFIGEFVSSRQKSADSNLLTQENRHLKDQLATLSKTHTKDMQRLSDMIDRRDESGRAIVEAARRSLPRPHPTIERHAPIFYRIALP